MNTGVIHFDVETGNQLSSFSVSSVSASTAFFVEPSNLEKISSALFQLSTSKSKMSIDYPLLETIKSSLSRVPKKHLSQLGKDEKVVMDLAKSLLGQN